MRYVLLIYTNEADRPAWGTPEGDAEAKAYEEFHGEITRRGLQSGEPLLRVAEAKSVRVRDGKAQVSDGPAVQTPEQLGVNDSATHVDFMVGSPELEIDGVEAGGATVPLLRDGRWQLQT